MKTFYLGNECKITYNALYKALSEVLPSDQFTIVQRNVQSDVPEQPLNDETLQGATNRCMGCMFSCMFKENDQIFCIGVENGLFTTSRQGPEIINIDGLKQYDNTDIKYNDKAIIVVRKILQEGNFIETIWESASIPVNQDFVPHDKDNNTWGEQLALMESILFNKDEPYIQTPRYTPLKLTVNANDPHYTICGTPKEDILYDTFKLFVRTVLD